MVTPLQHKIYSFIDAYIAQNDYSPSLSEIASGIGISAKSISLISRNVHTLIQQGWLKFYKKGYRNIQLARKPSALSFPVIGRIAAGEPIEALEDVRLLDLGEILHGDDFFVLEVKGDSMLEEGILNNDFVICKRTSTAMEGDIVVALIDQQEATLKRISYHIKDRITLIPANAALKPKAYLINRVQIQGIFMGLFRLKQKVK